MILRVVTVIVIGIFVLLLFAILINVNEFVESMAKVNKMKQNYYLELTKKEEHKKLSLMEKHTEDLLESMYIKIDNEIEYFFYCQGIIKKPYNIMNLEDDIKKISSTVFEAYGTLFSSDKYLSLKADYVMENLIKVTTMRLSITAITFNQSMTKKE